MEGIKPLLCVFVHPDDEAFGPGGAIAKFAKERDVYLICVTDGSAGKSSVDHDGDLGKIRREELLHSTSILGVKEVVFFDYKDGMLCNAVYHEIAEKILSVADRIQPEALLTFEMRGISGHLDHIAVSMITTFVYKKATSVREIYYYCGVKEAIAREKNSYFIYMPPGFDRNAVDMIINTEDVWEQKLQAMHCHKSQLHDIQRILSNREDLPKEEFFLVDQK